MTETLHETLQDSSNIMNKQQLLDYIKNVIDYEYKNYGSNSSKIIKSYKYLLDKVNKHFTSDKSVYVSLTKKRLNTGMLLETLIKMFLDYSETKSSPRGHKDLSRNRYYTELKTLIGASGAPKTTINQIFDNKGFIFLTQSGFYKMHTTTILEHLKQLTKIIDKNNNIYYRFNEEFITTYGVFDKELTAKW